MNRRGLSPSRDELIVSARDEGGCAVLTVVGELDAYTVATLRDAIHGLLSRGRVRLILDLSGVPFCDSSGLGLLVGGYKRTRARGGTFHLVGVCDHMMQVLNITGLNKVFGVHADVATAIAADNADVTRDGI